MVRSRIPSRGDIVHLNFTPSAGREMLGPHYGFVISPSEFNKSGLAYVAPITTGGHSDRIWGVSVSLAACGTETTGIIALSQIRAVDLKPRGARFKEKAPDSIIDEVFYKISAIFQLPDE